MFKVNISLCSVGPNIEGLFTYIAIATSQSQNGYESHFNNFYCDIAMWIVAHKCYEPILAMSQ